MVANNKKLYKTHIMIIFMVHTQNFGMFVFFFFEWIFPFRWNFLERLSCYFQTLLYHFFSFIFISHFLIYYYDWRFFFLVAVCMHVFQLRTNYLDFCTACMKHFEGCAVWIYVILSFSSPITYIHNITCKCFYVYHFHLY